MPAQANRTKLLAAVTILVLVQVALFIEQPRIRFKPASNKTGIQSNHISRVATESDRVRLSEAYARLPLSFEINQGQMDGSAKFFSRGRGYSLFLASTEAVLVLPKKEKTDATPVGLETARPDSWNIENQEPPLVRMQLLGSNAVSELEGVDELPGKANYFIGNDPRKWRTNVPTYARVRSRGVYPGIDLIYYGSGLQLEYDFEIAPGANPDAIRFAFKENEEVRIDRGGDLVVQDKGEEIRVLKPVAYQRVGEDRQEVAAEYVLLDQGTVGFKVGHYNHRESLVIDPVLSYATQVPVVGHGIAVDGSGNAYVIGHTLGEPYNAFVAKLNAAGTALVYSTYFGGSYDDSGAGIAVDASGNAYVTGWTQSSDFPTVSALQPASGGGFGSSTDAFVTKLNATGSALLYSTYLGGSGNEIGSCAGPFICSESSRGGIAVDGLGNAYVTGFTSSTDFPTASPLQPANAGGVDVFLAELNAAGSALLYSTYLGGNANDYPVGIAVDGSGNAYVAGFTFSPNFPTVSPLQPALAGPSDAFVAKLNAAGSTLLYSTYLGGSGSEGQLDGFPAGGTIAVDGLGNAYVTGFTTSRDFPTVNPLQPALAGGSDAFVAKLNAVGSALLYSTYLGGSSSPDVSTSIAVDSSANAYVTGVTFSKDFPQVHPFQHINFNIAAAFVTKLNAAGSALLYSSYLQGGGDGIAVDSSDNAYVLTGNLVAKIIDTFCFTDLQGRGTAAGRAPARVDLSWTFTGADSYEILRGTVSGGPYTLIGSSLTNVYSDSTVFSGGVYYYVAQSRASGASPCPSNEATVVVPNAR